MNKTTTYTIKRLAFVTSFGYLIPIYLGIYLDYSLSLPKFSFVFNDVVGAILFLTSLFLIFRGCYDLIKHGEGSPNPSYPTKKLVKSGLYKFIRHPIYLGWFIITLGTGIFFNSFSIFIFLAILAVFIKIYLTHEEKLLEKRFGRDYLSYKKSVPMFIPKFNL